MSFRNEDAGSVADEIIRVIQEHKQYLSDIDGAIGDGDHGINMSKGMHYAQIALQEAGEYTMSAGLEEIQKALMNKIGGSMGPLYGMIFRGFVVASRKEAIIDGTVVENMLDKAYKNLSTISEAKVGDKTLIDVLSPAIESYKENYHTSKNMNAALQAMVSAAEKGLDDTKNLVAKIGRASRLGDRSLGHQDAGATSCTLILKAMAEAMCSLNKEDVR